MNSTELLRIADYLEGIESSLRMITAGVIIIAFKYWMEWFKK